MEEILYDWNPWWTHTGGINELVGMERKGYISQLGKMFETRHVISIAGIRRSGKTTIMYQAIKELMNSGVEPKDILFLNMDDERLLGNDGPIEILLREYLRTIKEDHDNKTFIFIDEVQSQPGWEKLIKRYYDQMKNYKFIVSGSSSSLISSDYSRLLTGRNLTLRVDPLDFKEFLEFRNLEFYRGDLESTWSSNRENEDVIISNLEEYMKIGGFPEIVLGEGGNELLTEYLRAIIYRDIVTRNDIRNSEKLELLAVYVLRNFSNILSLRSISQASGLSPDTVSEYLGYLEKSFLIRTSRSFERSTRSQMRSNVPVKVYSTDLGMSNAVMMEKMENRGRWAENIMAMELGRRGNSIFYWREKLEVDIIIPVRKEAYQICYGNIRQNEIKALEEMPFKDYTRSLITRDDRGSTGNVSKIPLWTYLLSN